MKCKTFTMLEMVIVVAIISLLATIVIPQFMKYVGDSRRNACIANLKQIDTAVHAYCGLNGTETIPTLPQLVATGDAVNSYLKNTPVCPSGGAYSMPVDLAANPTCSLGSDRGHVLP